MKKIVIVGGGAGGLELATALGNKSNKEFAITLVDKNKAHIWKPLLHEIATGTLDDDIEKVSYVDHAKRHNFQFQQGAFLSLNREEKTIVIDELIDGDLVIQPKRTIEYDALVIAIGSKSNDFGTPGVKENCVLLDDHNQAQSLRKKIQQKLYCYANDNPEKKNQLNIAIVGAGATGVELASELYTMTEELHNYGLTKLSANELNVTLIESTDRILRALPEKLSNSITTKLENFGINVKVNTMITKADESGFYTKDGDKIPADIMVWAAGVKAPDFLKDISGLETNRANQLIVNSALQTTKDHAIFVIGDCASHTNKNGAITPPTAQAANQMANLTSKNIIAYLKDLPLNNFQYKDKGTIISLAHTAQGIVTVIASFKIIVKGWIASSIYHLLYRMHQASLHGICKTVRLVMSMRVLRKVKPTVKLD